MDVFNIIPDYIVQGLLLGYGSIGFTVGISVMIISDIERRKRIIDLFCSLIIAFATVALVWVTYRNLAESEKLRKSSQDMAQETKKLADETKLLSNETKRMANETQKLADASIEQFKIKSYPSFISDKPKINYKDSDLIQEYNICNRGEITAHKVRFLIVNVFQKENHSLYFRDMTGPLYVEGEPRSTIDYDTKILKDTCKSFGSTGQIGSDYSIEDLNYILVILRFWVPYDTKYRFETFGYSIQKREKYHAQELSSDDKNILIKRHYMATLRDDSPTGLKIREFLNIDLQSNE